MSERERQRSERAQGGRTPGSALRPRAHSRFCEQTGESAGGRKRKKGNLCASAERGGKSLDGVTASSATSTMGCSLCALQKPEEHHKLLYQVCQVRLGPLPPGRGDEDEVKLFSLGRTWNAKPRLSSSLIRNLNTTCPPSPPKNRW